MDIKENIFMKNMNIIILVYMYVKWGLFCLCNKFNVNILVLDILVLYLI